MEVTRFEVLDEVMNDVKLRILLWESVENWAKTIDDWYHADFTSLNVDDMNMFIAKNLKNINQLEKGLPSNLIVPKLRDEVELMKDKVRLPDHSIIRICTKFLILATCCDVLEKSGNETKTLDQSGEPSQPQVQTGRSFNAGIVRKFERLYLSE